MNTLIINGSPRENGNTSFLIKLLSEKLKGEVLVINTYSCEISPCTDCRDCWESEGCSIQDGMQAVYKYIKKCDNIVIASPMYFSELTGTLLAVLSRLQVFYAAERFLNIRTIEKPKKGAIILCGGGSGDAKKAESTAKILLKAMKADPIALAFSLHTDDLPAHMDERAIREIGDMAEKLNCG